ncbi:MAG TPA: hypothetical protein VMF08_09025 [Candidatus Sulfotelmatobacter sp.]|nr:hypothetical protein [Candidatus Sulfotelmatobacter sp.]
MKLKIFSAPVLVLIICLAALRLPACGFFFPNNLLNGGDDAVLAAPVADFEREMERMHLATNSFRAFITTNSYAKDSADAELADLQKALTQMDTPVSTAKAIIKAHQLERAKLQAFEENMESGDRVEWDGTDYIHISISPPMPANPTDPSDPTNSPSSPPFPDIRITPGLPEEFADYFGGAIAWENPAAFNSDLACMSWNKVLALPPSQRHFKSTWAAFMLGKYWIDKDPQKAIGYFQQTRQLAAAGFGDSCGLAAASFGLEALAELNRKNFEKAMLLYLQQLATGDGTAFNSLEFAAEHALATNDPAMLKQLAENPLTQRVVTAYLISYMPGLDKYGQAASWLGAVEAANVHDVASAEELALAAYQAGEWDAASRWAKRAPASPVSQWLEAKLLLRAGKIDEAGAMLAKVVQLMESKEDGISNQLKDNLSVECEESQDFIDASNEVLGELGVFHLSQRDYVESLDALLRSGFWMDAAYVAERILTVDELKAYVDGNWLESLSTNQMGVMSSDDTNQPPNYPHGWWNQDDLTSPDETDPATSIRYLLARRLARLNRNDEARAYYPQQRRPQFDALVNDLRTGRDTSLSADARAKALFAAAVMTRTNGMELLGTELEPDWLIYEGETDLGDSIRTNDTKVFPASADELQRYTQNGVEPEQRFHYRYQAADLAVEAAKLMPDNSEETAFVLCTAGSWIKYLDPKRADPIYKSLVRRCHNTQIGRQADLMRWFPVLDDAGHPIPYTSRAKENWQIFRNSFGSATDPGYFYYIGTIHMMDRENGWAQSAATLFVKTNLVIKWSFEQNAVLRTTNGGMSWKVVLCASPDISMALFAYDKDTAWVTSDYDESSNVWVLQTIDGGRSWGDTELTGPYAVQDCELSFPAANQGWILLMPDHGMNSMPGYLYASDEYGEDWRLINSTENSENNWNDPNGTQPGFADVHSNLISGGAIAFQNSFDGWLLGQLTTTTRAFLFFTHDGGVNWQEQKLDPPPSLHDGSIEPRALPRFFGTNGIVETLFAPNDSESTNFYTVFYDTHDDGQTWQPTTPVRFTGVSSFMSSETGWIWSPEPYNSNSTAPVKGILYRTDDGGQTWQAISKSLENYLTHGETIVQLDFVDDEYGWAVAQNQHNKTQLLKTTDGGETWNALDQ